MPSIPALLLLVILLGASHLGLPGMAAADESSASESSEVCLSDQPADSVDGEWGSALLDPEPPVACFVSDALASYPSGKQAEEEDSSVLPTVALTAPLGPELTVSTAAEPLPEPLEAPTGIVPFALAPGSATPATAPYEVEDNHDVQRFLDQFQTGYRRAVVERWLVRAGRYLPMVLDAFKQKGLPEELVFTAMIESGFDPLAVSRAGARGLWQFMAPTARRYGLRIDQWLDERLDPEKSTAAAARHFVDLYAVFGSWNLAQAAYNAGERTVLTAIRAMGTSDFWALARGRWLKDETKNYVPAIQAATLIAREPERYGFVVTPAPPLEYEMVSVPRATGLRYLARESGLDLEALERLNPELRLKQTPPDSTYSLKVPVGASAAIRSALERDPATRRSVAASHSVGAASTGSTVRPRIHVVKSKETISLIAKRYGVSVADLVRWNDLDETARIVPGERLRVAANREEAPSRSR